MKNTIKFTSGALVIALLSGNALAQSSSSESAPTTTKTKKVKKVKKVKVGASTSSVSSSAINAPATK